MEAADPGLVVEEAQQPLGAGDEQEGRDDGTGHRANAANDHDQQDLVGHAGFEGGGLHAGLIHGKHCAGDTGKEAADDKAHALVAGKVDAHGFGSDLVITDGFEGTAIGGVDEQQNDGDADAGEEEGHHGFQMQSYTAQ